MTLGIFESLSSKDHIATVTVHTLAPRLQEAEAVANILALLPAATGQLDGGSYVLRDRTVPASPHCLFGSPR